MGTRLSDGMSAKVKALLKKNATIYIRITEEKGELVYSAIIEKKHGSHWWRWSKSADTVEGSLKAALKEITKPKKKGKK